MKSVGLHGRVLIYMVESAVLHGGVLDYKVGVLDYRMGYWVTLWGGLSYMVGMLGYMVLCSVICWGIGLHNH